MTGHRGIDLAEGLRRMARDLERASRPTEASYCLEAANLLSNRSGNDEQEAERVVYCVRCKRCGATESNSVDATFPTVCRPCGAYGDDLVQILEIVRGGDSERYEVAPDEQVEAGAVSEEEADRG